MAPGQVQGLAAPVPQAVVGWPAACQLTWRRRVQADYSPDGLSVRRPLPPCRRLEHPATDRPTRTSPPPQTQRHPSSTHATHTGTAVSPSRVCHRRVRGLSAVRHALRPRQPGAPNPVESCSDGCADRGPGCPGEAVTQTKPNQPPPPLPRPVLDIFVKRGQRTKGSTYDCTEPTRTRSLDPLELE